MLLSSLSLSLHVFVCLLRSRLHVGGTSVNGRDGSRGGFGPHVVHQDSSNMFFAPRRACFVPRVCVQDLKQKLLQDWSQALAQGSQRIDDAFRYVHLAFFDVSIGSLSLES